MLFGILSEFLVAQDLPLNNQYMLNAYLLNPAVVVARNPSVRLNIRRQWVGIENAPMTIAASGQWLFGRGRKKNNGIGGYFFSDRSGVVNRFGVEISYAHRVEIDKRHSVAMGASLSGYQYSIDQRELTTHEGNDPAIHGSVETSLVMPDANVGVLLYSDLLYVGISATHLMQPSVQLDGESYTENKIPMHIFFTAGYKFFLADGVDLEPSVMINSGNLSTEFDINGKIYYYDYLWFGLSYRHQRAFAALLGFTLDKYYFGYAYEYGTTALQAYHAGSHEFMLGINFGGRNRKGGRGAVKCPAFAR